MKRLKWLGAFVTAVGILSAQQVADDPVVKVQEQRAQAGSTDADLPPVPRGIIEPPPLPPPEINMKDLGGGRSSRKASAAKRRASRRTSGHASPRFRRKAGRRR